MTVMYVTLRHADGYEQSYARAYPDHTPEEAYEYMLAILAPCAGDVASLTITTHTPTVRVTRTFTGGIA